MQVIVKYSDYNEVINEVELPINADQRKLMKVIVEDDIEKVQMDTIDDTISFVVTQKFTKSELRDYVQVLQKLLSQMK